MLRSFFSERVRSWRFTDMRLLVSFDSTTYVRPPIEFFTQLSRLHEFVSLLEGNGVKVSQIHIETFFFVISTLSPSQVYSIVLYKKKF